MNINTAKDVAVRFFSRTGLKLQKYSPEIFLGLGIVGMVGSTYLACKATLKIEEVNKKHKDTLELIETGCKEVSPEVYTEKDHQRDIMVAHVQRAINIGRLYAPAIGLGILSIGFILNSHGILTRRNAALLAAYKLMDEGYTRYRQNVVAEYGEEKDRELASTKQEKTIKNTIKEGEVISEEEVSTIRQPSVYSRIFDETCPSWNRDREQNLYFLRMQQSYANTKLRTHGHIFLNEVYEMLGFKETKAGQIVGWIYNGDGDNTVDFGIYDIEDEARRDFVNGYNNAILLDFNVDGVIYDKI